MTTDTNEVTRSLLSAYSWYTEPSGYLGRAIREIEDEQLLYCGVLYELQKQSDTVNVALPDDDESDRSATFNRRSDSTEQTGKNAAAKVDLGTERSFFDVFVNANSSTTLYVDVSDSRGSWRRFDSLDLGSGTHMEQFESTYRYARLWTEGGSIERLEVVRGH